MITAEYELKAFLEAKCSQPHDLLGAHPYTLEGEKGLLARVFLNDARSCEIVECGGEPERHHPMTRIAPEGFFEAFLPGCAEPFKYRLRVECYNGETREFFDPYSFWPTLGPQDTYLFNEGNEHWIHEKLGSRLRVIDGAPGVSFAVWAPNAVRVSVVGGFNQWDGRYHPMRTLGSSGIWELFIPGIGENEHYKYEILTAQGHPLVKTDPFASFYSAPPFNDAIVFDTDRYVWNDQEWIEARGRKNCVKEPLSIYEVHLESWRRVPEEGNRPLTYREAARQLASYVKEMGYTHVEFMPLAEHPFSASWGYQVTGFFAPTCRFGTPRDFQYLVDTLHQHGIGVFMDWVPGHFPRDSWALAEFDGTHLYEHADPRQGEHKDWGTFIFNYGRHEVRCFLTASALSWFSRFHVDGLRVDAVASMLYLDYSRNEGEWIPNRYGGRENIEAIEFLRNTNSLAHHYFPGVLMMAEESTSFGGVTQPPGEGGLGFDFKWNMGWMHDMLGYFQKDPIYRKHGQDTLTFGMLYQYSEKFIQVFSHDEVVYGKASLLMKMAAGSITEKAGSLRALYALMWGWPGKKCLFMGNDFGQSNEWNHHASLDWHLLQYLDHEGIRLLVRDLNALYRAEPALHNEEGQWNNFEWMAFHDADSSVIAFLRKTGGTRGTILVAGNYTPVNRGGYRIGVPCGGYWREVLNSNAEIYGGTGAGNAGGLHTDDQPWDNQPHSLNLTLPGSSTLLLRCEAG